MDTLNGWVSAFYVDSVFIGIFYNSNCVSAVAFGCFLSVIDFQRNVPNDFTDIGQKRVWLRRGDCVPRP